MNSLTREELLKRAIAGGAALSLPGLAPALARGATSARLAKTLTISNWPLYIDVDEKTKKRPTIEQFQKKTGIKVKYLEDINDNASFFGKIQGALSHGKSTGRDIIVMTDSSGYPALLVQKGWLEKLDKSAIPNIKNLVPGQQHPAWDSKREYSLPWQSGMTGIGYNAKRTKPITEVDQLLTDKKLHGKVTLLNNFDDTLGLVMLAAGDDPSKVTDAAFDKALKKVEAAFKSGQIRKFTGNDYSDMLAKGDIVAAFVWSGDMVQLHADNKNLKFVVPKSGGMIWTDNMLIPKGGDAKTASTFMNFVYDPNVAAQIEDYVNYICPVGGADRVLLKTDPGVAKNALIFPPKKTLSQLHQIDPKAVFNRDYRQKWQRVLGA